MALAVVAAVGIITVALPGLWTVSGVAASPGGIGVGATTTTTTGAGAASSTSTTSTTTTAATGASTTTTAATGTTTTTSTTGVKGAIQAANPALTCATPTIYNINSDGDLYALNFNTAANTQATPSRIGGGSTTVNGLGMTADGLTTYSLDQTPTSNHTTIHVENIALGTNTDYTNQAATGLSTIIAGGVNPTNGFYYYGGWNSAGNQFILFAFDPTAHTSSEAGTITPPVVPGATYGNGDLTFDGAGNMTVLAGTSSSTAKLLTVPGPVPTSGTGSLPSSVLATITAGSTQNYVGIAFAANSDLYVETAQGLLYLVNPNNGNISTPTTQTGFTGSLRDLASCTFNGSLAVQKNIVGRVAPTDQFTMTITGGGVSSGNTGTTSGSSTGVQTSPGSVAGPIVGRSGTTYSVAETAASGSGTSLSDYTTSWSCLNGSSAFSNGTGTTFTVPFPNPTGSAGASIVCTFTNTPASISVTKTPSPTTVTAAGQTITYSYTVKNTGPLPLTSVTVADTQTPPAGSLASGPTCVSLSNPTGTCSGATVATLAAGQTANFTATYVVSQADMNHGSVADSATASGNAPSGRSVSATATASVTATQTPSLSITKSASPTVLTAAGQTITYTFLVTNTGNVGLNTVGVTDVPTAPAGGVTVTCQSLSSPTGTCSGSTTSLAAGQVATFTGTYVVTQTDFDHGTVIDHATAAGTPPSGPVVNATSNPVTVTETQTPGLTISKSGSPSTVTAAGQTVTYTFTVHNTGNVDLTGVGVTDVPTAPAGGLTTGPTCQSLSSPTGTCSGSTTSLAPGQVATFTGTYAVTLADMNHGSIVDHATTQGTTPTSGTVNATSNTFTVTASELPSLSISKTANPTTVTAAGESVVYTFSVTNTGNVTVTAVGVNDVPVSPAGGVTATCTSLTSPTGTCSGATTTLLPGQTAIFNGTYVVTQADIDHGNIKDTATAAGTSPSNTPVTATSSQVTVGVTQSSSMFISKTANPTSVTAAGQTVTYTFSIHNTGNLTLTAVGVNDVPTAPAGGVTATCQSLINPSGTCSGATTTLLPDQTAVFTGGYTVSQADVDHGSIVDHATTQGTTPSGGTVNATSNTVTVTVTQSASLTISKTADPTTVTAAGQTVTYSFSVRNTGNLTLTAVSVTDVPTAPAGGVTATCQSLTGPTGTCSGATTTLLPGQTAVFTGPYAVTQADINHGSIVDHATTQGTTPTSGTVNATSNTVTVTVTQSPSLFISKTANPTSVTAAGQTVTYTFSVHNTGNLTLTAVGVTDVPTTPAGGVTATCQSLLNPTGTCSGATTTLLPDQTAVFTGPYLVTQADINHGSIVDHATTQGTTPSGGTVNATSNTVTVTVTQSPSLSIVKSATPTTLTSAGQTITYTFDVTNTGNVNLTAVGVVDNPQPPAGGLTTGPTCQSLSNPTGTCSGATTSLAPGQGAVFTATYVVTQADINHGTVVDNATVSGTTPVGGTVDSTSNTVTVSATQSPSLTIAKSASPSTVTAADQTVDYTFTVSNSGNVTLTGVGVTDVPTAPAGIVTATCQSLTSPPGTCSGATTTLLPGQIATFTGNYTVTQADIDHGSIVDHATTQGTTPTSGTVNATSNIVTVTATQSPSLSIAKSANPTTVSAAGQTVDYTFSVHNTGNVTVTGVGVTDVPTAPAGGVTATCQSLSSPPGTCSGATTALLPGQVATFSGSYTLTQADVDHGSIVDTALAHGTGPGNTPVMATSNQVTVTVPPTPSLSIAKSAVPTSVTAAGQSVTYTFMVENTGNVTLTSVGVADVPTAPAGGVTATCQELTSPSGTCSGATTSLDPGQTAVFSGAYQVTQADMNNGSIVDHATATGTPPTGSTVNATSNTVTVTAAQSASISIDKSAAPTTVTAAGQDVTYTFTVENTGNVTLTSVAVTDLPTPPAGGVTAACQSLSNPTGTCSGATTTLLPGQIAIFTGTYTVAQTDIDNGKIVDHASATGDPPTGPPVTDVSNKDVVVVVQQEESLSIVKTANPTTVTAAGQTVDYSFTVTNTGNVTLTDVGVTDNPVSPSSGVVPTCQSRSNPAGGCSGATTTLAPGANCNVRRHLHGDPGRRRPRLHRRHGDCGGHATVGTPGDDGLQRRDGRRDPVAGAFGRQIGERDDRDCRRPDRRLHLRRRQLRQRDPHQRGGHGHPDGAGWRCQSDLSNLVEPGRDMLGCHDDARTRPGSDLHGPVHRDPGRRRPRIHRRPRHHRGNHAVERARDSQLQHGHGRRTTCPGDRHRQDRGPDHGDRCRSDGRLHIRGHQHRERDSHQRRSDRQPGESSRRGHPGVPEPQLPDRNVLGRDDDTPAGPERRLHRHVCREPG